MVTETGICDLPADCLALVASLTSPGDACRLAATATALRSATDSDEVWKSFLPADCTDILARCSVAGDERRREGETNKELFSRLCDCPVLLDGGKLSFSLERHSGAKKYMIALWHGFGGYQYYGLEDSSSHTFTLTPGFAFVLPSGIILRLKSSHCYKPCNHSLPHLTRNYR